MGEDKKYYDAVHVDAPLLASNSIFVNRSISIRFRISWQTWGTLTGLLLLIGFLFWHWHGTWTASYLPDPKDTWWPLSDDQHQGISRVSFEDNVIQRHSSVDDTFGFLDREAGNFEPVLGSSPRPTLLARKLGLIAIPAGEKAKPLVNALIQRFGFRDFSFMIFHWDNATWNEFAWYSQVVSIRALGQTKFWFAKRYLVPDVVQNYDYIWLWDDDIQMTSQFDPVRLTETLKAYHIHFAQPSLMWGEHGLQGPVVRKRDGIEVGRFTTFVEVMIPSTLIMSGSSQMDFDFKVGQRNQFYEVLILFFGFDQLFLEGLGHVHGE
jgi:hypothetical protein